MTTLCTRKQTSAVQGVPRWFVLLWLFLLLLLGFWLRLSLLLGSVYHIDEFTSMLAANMVVERGLPILPSGLFYDHGLLLSFLMGALIALVGFSEQIARWPVLLLSVLTISVYYGTARRLFDSRITGLMAATLVTFDASSIIWGTRARMYTPAHLFLLLSLAFLLEGTLKHPSQRNRYLALIFLVAALFSHTVTFVIVPPLVALLIIFAVTYRADRLRHPRFWQEVIVVLIALGVVLAVVAIGQTGSTVSLQDAEVDAAPPFGLEFLRGFFSPGLGWSRFDNLVGFFEASEYQWLLPIIFLSLLVTLYRLFRRTATFPDIASLFLALLVVLVVFGMGALLTDAWSLSRYLFITVLPAFLLLSAESLARMLVWLAHLISRLIKKPERRARLTAAISLLGMLLLTAWWGSSAWDIAKAQGTGDYNTAFAFVRENWQPGDKVMTFHPAAAYLYLGRCDYYANQSTAKVLDEDGDEVGLIDRYTGSPLIDSVEEFNTALADAQRIWFVVDEFRLFNRYEPLFSQQVFTQMDVAQRSGEVYVFVSRPHPVPLPSEPLAGLDANFNNLIRLDGYSLDPRAIAPDGTTALGLYWRPIGDPSRAVKVFVHLRDSMGQTIAQADHFIYEGLLNSSEWYRLRDKGEWLRDSADLNVPLPLPADGAPYRIYVGLYDPATFERVPVLNDSSGENAVIIDLPDLP
jgi:4-amino-4-deoxy-L-arabinose transferase-like glycosyltransferase